MAPTLSLDDVVVASPDQVAADLGGEVIILGMKEGAYFSVSSVAERIWALVQSPHRLGDIVSTLTSEYEVTTDQCSRDVLAFAEDLCARGLLVRHVDATP